MKVANIVDPDQMTALGMALLEAFDLFALGCLYELFGSKLVMCLGKISFHNYDSSISRNSVSMSCSFRVFVDIHYHYLMLLLF